MDNPDTQQNPNYTYALKRVKQIKSFYTHLAVYIIVNAFLLSRDYYEHGINGFHDNSFNTLLFWGVGLAIHWFSVFGVNIILGKNWEQRKIKEYMDKPKDQWE
ncbi:MAG: histidine kinase [Flavobacteriales bacterium]|nr:MAG: histidine kinase [Flavobacteriales bacterium]